MNENEQIHETAKIIDDIQCVTMPIEACRAETRLGNSCAVCKAKRLYSEGYRKVERGEWIVTKTERAWNNGEIPMERSCEKCGLRRNIETQIGWNFCPHCGADMRGEDDV